MKHQPNFEGDRVECPESITHLEPERIGRQEIFDRVVAHYRKQKRRCTTPYGMCAYRGEDEDKCYIGALIDDADYDPRMEGRDVNFIMKEFSLPHWFLGNEDLLFALQQVHDTATNWDEGRMEMVLAAFAAERCLTFSP